MGAVFDLQGISSNQPAALALPIRRQPFGNDLPIQTTPVGHAIEQGRPQPAGVFIAIDFRLTSLFQADRQAVWLNTEGDATSVPGANNYHPDSFSRIISSVIKPQLSGAAFPAK